MRLEVTWMADDARNSGELSDFIRRPKSFRSPQSDI